MTLQDEISLDQDFEEMAHTIHDPFKNHSKLEWKSHTSPINPEGTYEKDVENAANSILNAVTGDEIGGTEFYYTFKESPGRIYITTPEEPLLAKGGVIAGNFGDPTYRNIDKANPDSILTELEDTYQHILSKYSTEYLTPRTTDEVHEEKTEFGSVFNIEIPPDYNEEEIQRTAQAAVEASTELNNLADQLIDSMETFRNG